MKATILSASCALLLTVSGLSQTVHAPDTSPANPPVALLSDNSPRFNLRFPGGTVREFITAVINASGRPVNIIIPRDAEAAQIPAVDVTGVTVGSLFSAITSASEIDEPSGFGQMPGIPKVKRTATIRFYTEEPSDSPEALWIFQATPSKDKQLDLTPTPVQYFPIAQYLGHFTVDDITTAIQSGCKLQTNALRQTPPPTLQFHEETKLLICTGTPQQIELINQVLNGLSQMLDLPRTDDSKNTRKATALIIPKLEFNLATVTEALSFIRKQAIQLDPDKKGVNIVLNGNGDTSITLSLNDVPVIEVLEYVAKLGGLELEKREHAIVLNQPGSSRAPQAGSNVPRPQPANRIPQPPPLAPGAMNPVPVPQRR